MLLFKVQPVPGFWQNELDGTATQQLSRIHLAGCPSDKHPGADTKRGLCNLTHWIPNIFHCQI